MSESHIDLSKNNFNLLSFILDNVTYFVKIGILTYILYFFQNNIRSEEFIVSGVIFLVLSFTCMRFISSEDYLSNFYLILSSMFLSYYLCGSELKSLDVIVYILIFSLFGERFSYYVHWCILYIKLRKELYFHSLKNKDNEVFIFRYVYELRDTFLILTVLGYFVYFFYFSLNIFKFESILSFFILLIFQGIFLITFLRSYTEKTKTYLINSFAIITFCSQALSPLLVKIILEATF